MNSNRERAVKRKAFETDKQAQVLVFDEGKYGIRRKGSSSSRAGGKRKHEDVVTSAPKDADEYVSANAPPLPLIIRSSVADMEVNEIWEKLKDTVEDIHTSNLRGKERKRYMFEKVTRLGGEPPKKQLAPMNIRIGIADKQRAREAKRQAQAREMDLVIAKSKANTSRSRKGRK